MITGANILEAVVLKWFLLWSIMESRVTAKCSTTELEVLVEEANKHAVDLQQRNINITQLVMLRLIGRYW